MTKNLVCKTMGEAVTSFSSVPPTEGGKGAENYGYVVLSCEAKQAVLEETTCTHVGQDDDADDLYI